MIVDRGRDVICDICGKTENVRKDYLIPDSWNILTMLNTERRKPDIELSICENCFPFNYPPDEEFPKKRKTLAEKILSIFKVEPPESDKK